jgi:vacuolar-type H+-ATPase subunit E/Vma4
MNDAKRILDTQMEHLLEVIRHYQDEQCKKILAQTKSDIKAIYRNAYSEARQRLHQNIVSSRTEMQAQIAAARARAVTESKMTHNKAVCDMLVAMRAELEQALERRWKSAESRQQWLSRVILQALEILPAGNWILKHPSDLNSKEKEFIKTKINPQTGIKLKLEKIVNMTAGISISSEGAVVDGTLQGLLTDRTRIEAEFLARCNH